MLERNHRPITIDPVGGSKYRWKYRVDRNHTGHATIIPSTTTVAFHQHADPLRRLTAGGACHAATTPVSHYARNTGQPRAAAFKMRHRAAGHGPGHASQNAEACVAGKWRRNPRLGAEHSRAIAPRDRSSRFEFTLIQLNIDWWHGSKLLRHQGQNLHYEVLDT
jgi:hypothetical protein